MGTSELAEFLIQKLLKFLVFIKDFNIYTSYFGFYSLKDINLKKIILHFK